MKQPTTLSHDRGLERHFSIAQAAERTSFSKTTIKDALRARELGFVKFGGPKRGRVLIPEGELVAWLERRGQYFPSADAAQAQVRS